jgi:cation diffusion facilitator family transporter
MVAIVIFGLGAGFAAYEGYHKLVDPHPVEVSWINYAVLGAAMVFEAFAWTLAFRAFQRVRGDLGFIEAVRRSKDPTLFTVLFEDTAAMFGLIIAFFGILAANITGNPFYDALATCFIALVLALTAIFLAIETKGLLVGEAASPKLVKEVRAIIARQDGVKYVNELLTLHFGPNEVLVTASVDFRDGIDSGEVERTVSRIEDALRAEVPIVKRVFIEAQSLAAHLARALDGAPSSGGPAAADPA